MNVIIFAGTLSGLLIAGLSLPLIWRKVPPNNLYGLRVRATFADEWVWYEANARSGRDLLIVGVATVAATLLPAAAGADERAVAISMIVVLLVGVIWAAISGTRYANRLERARRVEGDKSQV